MRGLEFGNVVWRESGAHWGGSQPESRRLRAGRLFNWKTEERGQEPTARGRYEGQVARATTSGSAVALCAMARLAPVRSSEDLYTFLRNEPTDLCRKNSLYRSAIQ